MTTFTDYKVHTASIQKKNNTKKGWNNSSFVCFVVKIEPFLPVVKYKVQNVLTVSFCSIFKRLQ